jgi:hypothetical protein
MSKVSVDCLHRIGFLFIGTHFVGCTIVQVVLGRKGIAVVLSGSRSTFQGGLQVLRASFTNGIPTEQAVGSSVNDRQNVDFVFFCFTKVYNSSNSATFGLGGIGVDGNLAS